LIVATAAVFCWQVLPLVAQGKGLTVEQLTRIYMSGGDVMGWDEFDVPEFVAAAYGQRAREAVEKLLSAPVTGDNFYTQLEAVTTRTGLINAGAG